MQTQDSKCWFKCRYRKNSVLWTGCFISTWHTSEFDSFLVTKNENLNPSPLPSVWWENAKPAHTKLAVGFWWREEWLKLPYRSHETSAKAAAINSQVTSYQRWAVLNEGFEQMNGKWRVVGQEDTAVPQLTCMIEYCQGNLALHPICFSPCKHN